MGLKRNKLITIKKKFEEKYFLKEPYSNYVNGCGISKLRIAQMIIGEELTLKKGETLEDLCLSVTLEEQPPSDLELPKEYKGVRIFYEVVGKIKLL